MTVINLIVRAAIIAVLASVIGIAVNFFSPNAVPWLYTAPKKLQAGSVSIPMIDEKTAFESMDDPDTLFIDARDEAEFSDGHIRGAISMPEPAKEEVFPSVQALLFPGARIILYCHDPECQMAAKVATFLADLGYKNLQIMSPGFNGWKKAGYPVEGPSD